eukprot:8153224-Pyramimonas_sp.AAC.1
MVPSLVSLLRQGCLGTVTDRVRVCVPPPHAFPCPSRKTLQPWGRHVDVCCMHWGRQKWHRGFAIIGSPSTDASEQD